MTYLIEYVFQVKIFRYLKDLNILGFNMITGKNESKILTKDISCECKCRFHGKKCNSVQWWNNNKCLCECTKRHVCEKDYIWKPATCRFQNGKLKDEETKTFPTNFNEKNITYKTQNLYILLIVLLITITLLIAVSIYCYLIKYRAKRKYLLPFHSTSEQLKEPIY